MCFYTRSILLLIFSIFTVNKSHARKKNRLLIANTVVINYVSSHWQDEFCQRRNNAKGTISMSIRLISVILSLLYYKTDVDDLLVFAR